MEAVKKEPVLFEGYVIMPYKYSVGSLASKFFIKIRDSKVLSGAKCPKCHMVNFPPRSVCPEVLQQGGRAC